MPAHSHSDTYTLELAEEHIGDLRGATDLLSEAHAQDDATDIPDTPATGHIMFASAGHMRYASGTTGDGVYYATGRNTNVATNDLALTTSFQTMPGLSVTVGIGTYHLHAQLLVNPPASAGGTLAYQVAGSATVSNGRYGMVEANGAGGNNSGNVAADYNTLGNPINGTSPNGAANRIVRIDGIFIVTVAGNLTIQAKQTATANATIVQYGSYVECMPVL